MADCFAKLNFLIIVAFHLYIEIKFVIALDLNNLVIDWYTKCRYGSLIQLEAKANQFPYSHSCPCAER